MGWYRVAELQTEKPFDGVPDGPAIWSRGGLEGLSIQTSTGECIDLPREIVLGLVADEFRNKQLSRYEDMDTEGLLREMGLS